MEIFQMQPVLLLMFVNHLFTRRLDKIGKNY